MNDVFGHAVGDRLGVRVAERIGCLLAPEAFLSRFGGDEFVALVPGLDACGSAALARTIAKAFATPFSVDGNEIRLTASVETKLRRQTYSSDDLIRDADAAMRRAKTVAHGRSADLSQPLRARRRRDGRDRRPRPRRARTASSALGGCSERPSPIPPRR